MNFDELSMNPMKFFNRLQIRVLRSNDDKSTILKSIPDNFIFADQFLQMSFSESGHKLYGLGEHRGPLMYNLTEGKTVALWNRDAHLTPDCNEYGSHPMYMLYEEEGKAHGVVLMNRYTLTLSSLSSSVSL